LAQQAAEKELASGFSSPAIHSLEQLLFNPQEVSGHDFSRAGEITKKMMGF
jgi:hypothetical protein